MIRAASTEDAADIVAIYNHYVENDAATFEEQSVSVAEMSARIEQVESDGLPWLVVVEDGALLGYAYASKWKTRSAYRFSAEISVYLDNAKQSKGIGTQLYTALFERLESSRVHTVIGGITLPNPASVALHEKFGMTKVAQFKEVGYKFGERHDVGYWQAVLEKRANG